MRKEEALDTASKSIARGVQHHQQEKSSAYMINGDLYSIGTQQFKHN